MNYGKSAYTKVLELEKRIGDSEKPLVQIFDSGNLEEKIFTDSIDIFTSNLIFEKDLTTYFKVGENMKKANIVNIYKHNIVYKNVQYKW